MNIIFVLISSTTRMYFGFLNTIVLSSLYVYKTSVDIHDKKG